MTPEPTEIWYRLDVVQYGHMDEWDNVITGNPVPCWREYYVRKTTPKGVWLSVFPWENKEVWRFVLRDAKKRYACPTKAEAKASFVFRKKRQIQILSGRLREAKAYLAVGEMANC